MSGAMNSDRTPVQRKGEKLLQEAGRLFESVSMGLREDKLAAALGTDDKIIAAGLGKLVAGIGEEFSSLRAEVARLKRPHNG